MSVEKTLHRTIAEKFLLTKREIALIVGADVAFLLGAWTKIFIDGSKELTQIEKYFRNDVLSMVAEQTLSVVDMLTSADTATVALWSIVGAVVYILVMFVISVAKDLKLGYKMSAGHYIHPTGVKGRSIIVSAVIEKAVSVLSLFCLIWFSYIFVDISVPYVYREISESVSENGILISVPIVFVSIAIFSGLLHLWVVIARLVVNRHQ